MGYKACVKVELIDHVSTYNFRPTSSLYSSRYYVIYLVEAAASSSNLETAATFMSFWIIS